MMKTLVKPVFLLVAFLFIACENEPIGEIGYTTDFIFVDSELYDLIKRVTDQDSDDGISCIEFNYPFPLFVFDDNQEFLRAEGINSNESFIALLESLQEGESISLSYPITGITSGGNYIEINTNEELKQSMDDCQHEEILSNCNGALCQSQCAWVITTFSNTDFEGGVFRIDITGVLNFYYASNVYFGTWTTYFVEDQLYISIYLNDNSDVGEAFNFEWELDYTSDEFMTLTNGSDTLSIDIDCELPCFEENYTQCGTDATGGTANFSLSDYILCFGYAYVDNTTYHPLTFLFYETEEDAQNGENAISPSSYTNNTNPQTIYFSSLDMETGNVTGYGSFNIKAVACD